DDAMSMPLLRTSRKQLGNRRPAKPCLAVELLEERCLLSYSVVDVGTLPGFSYPGHSIARAINAYGEVVGTSYNRPLARGFLYREGHLTGLDAPSFSSSASGINDYGQIVGGCGSACLWQDGTPTELGTLGDASTATAINNLSQVVGFSSVGGTSVHAFVWQ